MKASFKNYYGHLWELFFYVAFFLFLPKILGLIIGREPSEMVTVISIIGGVAFSVPAIVLLWRYVAINKDVEIEYLKNKINVLIDDSSRTFEMDEIEHIEIRVTLPVFYNGFRYFATDSYFYAVIYLKSKESFVVTSLIDNELIETIDYFKDKATVERKWSFICWPPAHNLM